MLNFNFSSMSYDCGSSSQKRGLVCMVLLSYFLIILTCSFVIKRNEGNNEKNKNRYEPRHVISNNVAFRIDSDDPVQPSFKLRNSK